MSDKKMEIYNPLPAAERWLGTREVKDRFGISRTSLWRMVKDKQIKLCKLRRKNLYNMQEIMDHIERVQHPE